MSRSRKIALATVASLTLIFGAANLPEGEDFVPVILVQAVEHSAAILSDGMVASQEARASAVGARILAEGGNAFDAAAATHFALAVTLPRAGPISGGGFMIVHSAETGETIAIDYKESAPAAASADMFIRPNGAVDDESLAFSRLGAGVPGLLAAIDKMLEKYGTMSLAEVIQPALEMARWTTTSCQTPPTWPR